MCGLCRTTGSAAGSTRYVIEASGKRCLIAATAGVVNTTSPMSRRRMSTNFTWPSALLLRSGLDRGLVDQHHRDVVLDGIDASALGALERGTVFHELNGRLARRADQNLEELGIDRHRLTIR